MQASIYNFEINYVMWYFLDICDAIWENSLDVVKCKIEVMFSF